MYLPLPLLGRWRLVVPCRLLRERVVISGHVFRESEHQNTTRHDLAADDGGNHQTGTGFGHVRSGFKGLSDFWVGTASELPDI